MRRVAGILARLRLRHKLTISLSIAALLPVLVVWWVAARVVIGNLDHGIKDDTRRQLRVGSSLLLRTVQRISADAAQVAGAGDLANLLPVLETSSDGAGPDSDGPHAQDVRVYLDRVAPYLPSCLIQVFDARGQPVEHSVVGDVEARFQGLMLGPDAGPVRAGVRGDQQMTIEFVARRLVVRASAPVLDNSFRIHGVVVISVPLDRSFAHGVKGALGTDVLLFAGPDGELAQADSTFLEASGEPAEITIDREVARRVFAGEQVSETADIAGRSYVLGYTPLVNLDGDPVGIFAVAVDRAPLATAQRVATRSLVLSAAGAVLCALVLGYLLSRRLTGPLSRLHRGAQAIARGDLEYRITVAEGDEIGALATAFAHMTGALKENRERLAARMDEIMALHEAARAMSSVIDLDQVLRRIVDSAARVLDVRLCALWLVEVPDGPKDIRESGPLAAVDPANITLRLGAARAKPLNTRATMHGEEGAIMAEPLRDIAREVARSQSALRVDDVADQTQAHRAAMAAGVTGSLLAMPLEHADQVLGVIVVGRTKDVEPFSDADLDLLSTFADQASSAVANARLYQEVRAFNEELETAVRARTAELTHANAELEKTLRELRETQAQLISSERMAGLGLLVASVAHEINSPSAAIAGSVDALHANVARFARYASDLQELALDPAIRRELAEFMTRESPALAARHLRSGAAVKRAARALRQRLEAGGYEARTAKLTAARLAELDAGEEVTERFLSLLEAARVATGDSERAPRVVVGYLSEHVLLERNALTIRNAIGRVQRIVGALKRYSHLDQQASSVDADVHDGIEDTLVILDYALRDIKVIRRYGDLPHIPVYVDELNQVWTNLIQNAVQALDGRTDGCITIETSVEPDAGGLDGVAIRIIDTGPGIPEDVLPKIFEPFFTTKPKGEGTGLGLGIVRQIVEDKHRGRVTCESRPGHTVFRVWLPRTPAIPEPEVVDA